MNILNRLPRLAEIFPVLGLIMFMLYGWTFGAFSWMTSGWVKYLPIQDIGALFCYSILSDFLESLMVLLFLELLSLLLPLKFFRDDFIFRGSLSALCIVGFFILLTINQVPYEQLPIYTLSSLILWVILHFILGYLWIARQIIESIANRAIIFLYLLLPLTLIAFLVVVFRNIGG